MKDKKMVSLQLWLPGTVYERVISTGGEDGGRVNKSARFRNLLVCGLSRHLGDSDIPLRIDSESERKPTTVCITISQKDYASLTDMAEKVGLSKKKLAEILICEEVQ